MINPSELTKLWDISHSGRMPVKDLLKLYMQKLIDDGKMMRLRDIKKMDILDTMGFMSPPDNGYGMPHIGRFSKEEREIGDRLGWYAYIPCFEKGAVKFNTFRYIVFEMIEIDPENKSMKIKLRDYIKSVKEVWEMGVGVTIVITDTSSGNINKIRYEIEDKQNFEELYTMYSAKDLGWTKSDYRLWLDTIVANAKTVTKEIKDQSGSDQCEELALAFMGTIVRCNAMLEMNKPSRPIKKENIAPGKRKIAYEKGKNPERKIRNVGALRVQSKEIPRKPSLETVITYKTAKWSVRGHIRRYKNGKEVYIKPSIRTRKALAGTEKTTATTIRFKKKKGCE